MASDRGVEEGAESVFHPGDLAFMPAESPQGAGPPAKPMGDKSALPKPGSWRAALRRLTRTQRQILALLCDPALSRSYWPDEPRKSKTRVLSELVSWLLRTGEANNYYYVYGMDRRSVRRTDVMSFRGLQCLRNQVNLRLGMPPHNYNYVCVLRDKFLFAQFAASLGIATPQSIAMLNATHVSWLADGHFVPLESLLETTGPVIDGFCKKLDGMRGDGAFPLRTDHGRLWVGHQPIALEDLRSRLTGRFLWQRRIVQHPQMDQLHAGSVNTLRLVSFFEHGQSTVAYGALRLGTGTACVDNWAAGGVIVAIDLQRGALRGDGFFKPGYGGRTPTHPDSGIVLDGFVLPYFAEAMAMVKRLHEYLPRIHSIGWDVAITPDGPVIIEGNDDWDGVIQMVLERGFRQRFASACEEALRH